MSSPPGTGFCSECGEAQGSGGGCACSSPLPVASPWGRAAGRGFDDAPRPSLTVGAPGRGIGAIPGTSTGRRLLSSGLEFAVVAMVIVMLKTIAVFTAGLGSLLLLFLFFFFLVRDLRAGAFSFGKRVGGMRVVDGKSGQGASNGQGILRNSYYMLLFLFMSLPVVGWLVIPFFFMATFIDFLMIALSPRGRRFGDLLAGTQVVYEARE